MMSWIRWSRSLLIAFAFLPWSSVAKTVSGDFKLSGMKSLQVLTSFSVVPDGALLQLNFTSPSFYENERFLKLRLYRDSEWASVVKAQTCVEKIKLTKHTGSISFDYKDKLWKSSIQMFVNNEKYGGNKEGRPHYWYIAVDDCQLEQFMMDASVPLIHYDLTIQNHLPKKGLKSKKQPLTHLSGDELQLTSLHTVTMMLSGLVAFFLVANVIMSLSSQHKKTVHVALLWVAAAAALDAMSSLCEILHLKVYQGDGIGSYALDAMACHFEAVCDSFLVLLLLSIGAGWTLPSDAVTVNPNASSMQRFLMDMSKPIGSLYSFNGAAVLGIGVISMHTILAQWGRTYNDDFESYHDLEHLPGKILMFMRLILGFLLLAATMQTRLKCNVQQLKAFYVKLAIFGFCWFQSLPLLTVICNVFVPYYLRRPAIAISCALLQSSSLVILAWLVTAHTTAYHHFSHMTADSEPSLTDTLSYQQQGGAGSSGGKEAPSTWTIGKSKIRLD
jgi:hypothetical protein